MGTMQIIDAFADILYFTVVNKEVDFAQFDFQPLMDRYRDMISQAERKVRQPGGRDALWSDALFAVCVWIDEAILLSKWQHRLLWRKQSLQRTFYHTANGGGEFYRRLGSFQSSDTELLEIYDVVMSMGFKGELFRETDTDERLKIAERTMRLLASNRDMSIPKTIFGCAYGKNDPVDLGSGRNRAGLIRAAVVSVPPLVFVLVYLVLYSKISVLAGACLKLF